MEITAIKAQVKSENRVSIFLDSKYSFSLTLDQLLEEKLKKGDEVDDSRLKNLKRLSDEGKLKQRTLEWVMGRPHSTREFRDYLYRKKAEKDLIEAWVIEFTDKKFLDDEAFARWFAENRLRKNKSSRAIYAELMSKGIESSIIKTVVGELENGDEGALSALVAKLQSRPRYKDEQKLKQHLVSKGFRYDDIKRAIES